MSTPVFWLEETDRVRVRLRRYRSSSDPCPSGGYCGASVLIAESAPRVAWREHHRNAEGRRYYRMREELVARDDPRWPTACDACGRAFDEDDPHQVRADELYAGAPDGELYTLLDAPPGAMWDAWWLPQSWKGADGIALMVRLPNGHDWAVDNRASNCTKPDDWPRHRCWVRHGDPRDPQGVRSGRKLHVDKNGDTCAAGAGSILAGDYHGFLHNGALT